MMAVAAVAAGVACGRLLSRAGARAEGRIRRKGGLQGFYKETVRGAIQNIQTSLLWSTDRSQSSHSTLSQQGLVPKTSLSSPPWPEVKLPDPIEEAKHHKELVQKVNELIATGQYGRLFAVVYFASRQWKVTNEDLILIESHIPAECGDRIRMEKVLLVGADDFTLLGKPLLGKDLVRVEATVIEKTEAWPRMYMRFRRRRRFQRKRIIIQPQTVLRINTIEIAPILS